MNSIAPPAPTKDALSPYETGPGTPAGRYLRMYWQPVGVSSDLPVGRVKPIQVMSERFTLYRGESGAPVVTQSGCPHRQTALSIGSVEGDSIRCMFHGWKFGVEGHCEEAPGQSENLVKRMRIQTYPTHEAYGVIFAYFGEGTPPRFHDLEGFSDKYGKGMSKALVHGVGTYKRKCNYYINVENALDTAHVAFTHRLSSDPEHTEMGFAPGVVRVRDITVERYDFGVRAIEVDEQEPVLATVMVPNVMHLVVAQRDGFLEQFAWRVPIDDVSHYSYQIEARHVDEAGRDRYLAYQERKRELMQKFPPSDICAEQILSGEKTVFDFRDHPDLVNIEDHVAQMGVQYIDNPGQENLAQSDKGVLQLRRMFMSRLADFVAGAPTPETDW